MAGFSPEEAGGGAPTIKDGGSVIGTRQGVNFIEGANVTINVVDDPGNNEVDVTISASVAGSSGVDIKEEGGAALPVTSIDFVGSMTTASAVGAAGTITTAHGAQAGGTTHADVVAAGASGFMTGSDKTKLDGIATGATNGITTQDEGAGGGVNQTTLNFVGSGVTAASVGAVTTVTVAGSSVSDGDKGDIVVSGSGTAWALDSGVVTAAARTVLDDATVANMVDTLGGAASTGTGGLVRAAAPALTGVATADRISITATTGNALTVSAFAGSGHGAVITGGNAVADGLRSTCANSSSNYAVRGDSTGTDGNGLIGTTGNSAGVTGVATATGVGVVATNTSTGYPLKINQDLTSPARAGINWPAGDALPTGAHVVGDIANVAGVIYACTAAGTPGTWTRVGDQLTTNANLTGPITSVGNATTIADPELAAIAGLTSAADSVPYFTGSGTAALATVTSAARTVLDDTTVGAMVDTLGGAASTGTGGIARANSPVFTTPNIGSATGSISGNAATVTTNANLTGVVTSVGNATAIANGAIALAKLANGTDGEIPTWDSSGVITTVAVGTSGQVLTSNGAGAAPTFQTAAGGGNAQTANPLSQFAATTSAQLAGVISDETGSGALVFATSPTLVTPVLGVAAATSINKVAITAPATSATLTIADGATLTASATATVSGTNTGDQTNITGNAATVTTNANLTGPITSVGNATTIADAELAAIAGLTSAADRLPYFTGSGTASLATFTAAGRAIVDDADAAAQRTTLGLVIGTNVQAQDAELAAIAGLTSAADTVPYFTGSGTAALASLTSAGRALMDDADASAQRTTLGLVIGTNVQAYDAELAAIAGLTSAADRLPYFTGSGTAALATFSSFARTYIDDADAAATRTTLGAAASASPVFTGNVSVTIPSTVTTAGTTATIDWANGVGQNFDAQGSSGNITFTFSNPASGASYVLLLQQGSTARTYTWPATVKWLGGTAPTVSTTDNDIDMVTFFYNGTNYIGSHGGKYTP